VMGVLCDGSVVDGSVVRWQCGVMGVWCDGSVTIIMALHTHKHL